MCVSLLVPVRTRVQKPRVRQANERWKMGICVFVPTRSGGASSSGAAARRSSETRSSPGNSALRSLENGKPNEPPPLKGADQSRAIGDVPNGM